MRQFGINITCDECGNSVFLKRIVFGRCKGIDKYEAVPEGWKHLVTKDVCPNCMKKKQEIYEKLSKKSKKSR